MKRRVVVTGLGAITPIGKDVNSFWQASIEGKSGIGAITQFDAKGFNSRISGEVKDFNPTDYFSSKDIRRMERFVQFSLVASRQALEDSGLDLEKEDRNRIGVLVGSGIGSLRIIEEQTTQYLQKGPSKIRPLLIPMLIVNEAAGLISINFGLKGPNLCITTACATGNHSIGDAFRIIQHNDADIMFAGGTESCITAMGVGGFCAMKALSTRNDEPSKASRPFDAKRDGFIMGEGAGIVILEELGHAKKRNAKIYAELAGFGMSADAYHITAPDPEGEGAARAMNQALYNAGFSPKEIDYINAHGTSTQLNDKVETKAIKKVLGDYAKKVMVSSTKSMIGHLLGAAGGVEFIICCLSIKHNIVPPTINYEFPDPECDLDYVPNTAREANVEVVLSNSLGFGGHNAALVVKKFKS